MNCAVCPADKFSASVGSPASCTSCPFGNTVEVGVPAVLCNLVRWMNVGTLAAFDNITSTYSQYNFEYGVAYNGDVQVAAWNLWNGVGIRLTLYPFFPQGDTATSMYWGTVVFTRNLLQGPQDNEWYEHYYQLDSTGGRVTPAGNGVSSGLTLWVRPLLNPWFAIGNSGSFDALRSQYPSGNYEWGTRWNGGQIQLMMVNGWNLGTRISLFPFQPQGDDPATLYFGTSLFTRGLAGAAIPTAWYQNYIRYPTGNMGSSGPTSLSFWVRNFTNDKWVSNNAQTLQSSTTPENTSCVGVSNQQVSCKFSKVLPSFSPLEYEYGLVYNGPDIQSTVFSYWSVGIRATLYPFFPMGDTQSSLFMGTVIMNRGLLDKSDKTLWYQAYYQMNANGFTESNYASNGIRCNLFYSIW